MTPDPELTSLRAQLAAVTRELEEARIQRDGALRANNINFSRARDITQESLKLQLEVTRLRNLLASANGELPIGQDLIADRDAARAESAKWQQAYHELSESVTAQAHRLRNLSS